MFGLFIPKHNKLSNYPYLVVGCNDLQTPLHPSQTLMKMNKEYTVKL